MFMLYLAHMCLLCSICHLCLSIINMFLMGNQSQNNLKSNQNLFFSINLFFLNRVNGESTEKQRMAQTIRTRCSMAQDASNCTMQQTATDRQTD